MSAAVLSGVVLKFTHAHSHYAHFPPTAFIKAPPLRSRAKSRGLRQGRLHIGLTLAQVARPAMSLKRPEPLTSSDGAAAALNLNGGARRKPPLSQLGPAAPPGHYEIRQLRLHSMQIAVLFVLSCAASHSRFFITTSR
jgi:hypothetical protein